MPKFLPEWIPEEIIKSKLVELDNGKNIAQEYLFNNKYKKDYTIEQPCRQLGNKR